MDRVRGDEMPAALDIAYSEADVETLLVEDNSSDAELTVRELKRYMVVEKIKVVKDGAEALDFLFCRGAYRNRSFARPPKVILLDLKLPKVDGLEVLKAVKSDSRTRVTPVVMLTSSSEHRDVIESFKLGVNAFIQKPVDFDEFRRMIEYISVFWLSLNRVPRQ